MTINTSEFIRHLHIKDNIAVLRRMRSESVDLIYLDPPFNSGQQWENPIDVRGKKAEASFSDTWKLGDMHVDEEYELGVLCPGALPLIEALQKINGDSWRAYLTYMGVRLAEMKRILKPTGSIYYHCDPVMSHGVKLLMDVIFDKGELQREIIWRIGWISGYKSKAKNWIRNHDTILFYVKNKEKGFTFNKEYIPYADDYVRRDGKKPNGDGYPIEDTWNCSEMDILNSIQIMSFSKEKTGYPTQKPLLLLSRIIKASSNEGDMVLDPFCGCATTMIAAEKLNRQWIGIDIGEKAADLFEERIKKESDNELWGNPQINPTSPDWLYKRNDLPTVDKTEARMHLHKIQEGKCAGCDRPLDLQDMHLDHIIPVSRGGHDILRNFQLLCMSCNAGKRDMTLTAWRRKVLRKRIQESMEAEDKKRREARQRAVAVDEENN